MQLPSYRAIIQEDWFEKLRMAVNKFRGLSTNDLMVDSATEGLVLRDTQSPPHYWRVRVSNVGVLTTTDLGTTKP